MDSSRTTARYRGGAGAGASSSSVTQPPAPPPPPPPVITLQYFGSHLDLTHRWLDPRDEVIIEQQHCGGNTVYVYRDRVSPGGTLLFVRHCRVYLTKAHVHICHCHSSVRSVILHTKTYCVFLLNGNSPVTTLRVTVLSTARDGCFLYLY